MTFLFQYLFPISQKFNYFAFIVIEFNIIVNNFSAINFK